MEVARSGYLAGQIDFFNLTDAEQTLLRFGLGEVEARTQRELALAELALISARHAADWCGGDGHGCLAGHGTRRRNGGGRDRHASGRPGGAQEKPKRNVSYETSKQLGSTRSTTSYLWEINSGTRWNASLPQIRAETRRARCDSPRCCWALAGGAALCSPHAATIMALPPGPKRSSSIPAACTPRSSQHKPGNCPICGMKLTPVRKQAGHEGCLRPSARSNTTSPP